MAARFVGAGPARARRRRRLILWNPACETAESPVRKGSATSTANDSGVPEPTRVVSTFNSLIRPQPWVNWLIITAGFALWGGVVFWGWTVDHSGSGLKEVAGLKAGRLCRFLTIACLFAATQLSLVILWYRTQSRKDFQGRYRVWIWSSLTWAMLFSASLSGWHHACCRAIASRLPLRLQGITDLLWLLPAAMLVGTACRLLSREVASTRSNHWLLRFSVVAGTLAFLLEADPGFISWDLAADVRNACTSLWALLTASVLLHQARYVIHVSNEVLPRERRPGRLSPILRQVWSEVLTLGPSRRSIARSLQPKRIWRGLKLAGGLLQRLSVSLTEMFTWVLRRQAKAVAPRSKRRKETTSLPATAGGLRPKSSAKSALKAAKPV